MNGNEKKPAEILDVGWQFYTKPTDSDPPGTVFRIDPQKKRYKVDELKVRIEESNEASGKSVRIVKTRIGILARIMGLFNLGAKREVIEKLEFEMKDPVKEETKDMTIKDALDQFLANRKKWGYRADNRYYVIRETKKASGIKYYLSKEVLNQFGAGGPVIDGLDLEGQMISEGEGKYRLEQEFAKPMRVMYLPEEITTIARGLAGSPPVLGTAPVKEVLFWEE